VTPAGSRGEDLSFSECALVNPGDQLAERGPGAHLLDRGM
jgi:hypothetical protein